MVGGVTQGKTTGPSAQEDGGGLGVFGVAGWAALGGVPMQARQTARPPPLGEWGAGACTQCHTAK